jgi:hypothetical protein
MKNSSIFAAVIATYLVSFMWLHAQAEPVFVTNAPAAGTFFLLSGNPSLPWPFDPYSGALPVYSYDGVFFVDDSQVGDLSLQQESFGGGMMSSSLPGPGGDGGGCTNCVATNICSGPTNFTVTYQLATTNTPPYSTNDLWLEMTVATNNVANLIIHTPNTNAFFLRCVRNNEPQPECSAVESDKLAVAATGERWADEFSLDEHHALPGVVSIGHDAG